MSSGDIRQDIHVAVHHSLRIWEPEIQFVVRTLFTVAGYPARISWLESTAVTADVYYGPAAAGARVSVWIPSCGRSFTDAPSVTARSVTLTADSARIAFDGVSAPTQGMDAEHVFQDDIVFASYWLLTGAREPYMARSRADDLDYGNSPLVRDGMLDAPLVSLWGASLRAHFSARGRPAMSAPWAREGRAAFAFTHDVDYPEIIPWIEAPRLLAQRHAGGPGLAWRVLTGQTNYWTFDEWITLERDLGAKPCFYFMARQGSLLQYALGTPDDFYDVRNDRFRRLFASLREAGAEIGLHASYRAHRSAEIFRAEIDRLREASGGPVYGNRHHYWHLDPDDPNTTLSRHAEAGLRYDSSLGLEYYPGFRRGICHPFRPFHPATRRILDIVQLPPAWMDDHFDRRLAENGIASADDAARRLVTVASQTNGIVVVDYHSRGMNREIYPRWGGWLDTFSRSELAGRVEFLLPHEIAGMFTEYEKRLAVAA